MILQIIIGLFYLMLTTYIFKFIYKHYLEFMANRSNKINHKRKEKGLWYYEDRTAEDIKSPIAIPFFFISGIASIICNIFYIENLNNLKYINSLLQYQIAFFCIYLVIISIYKKIERSVTSVNMTYNNFTKDKKSNIFNDINNNINNDVDNILEETLKKRTEDISQNTNTDIGKTKIKNKTFNKIKKNKK